MTTFAFPNGMTPRNRYALAPMTTWSGNPDGTVSEEELTWMRARVGGVGLALTACSHVTPEGQGFTDEFACHDDRFLPSLRALASAAKSGGALAVLQIFHAGNKALPGLDAVSASAVTTTATPFAPALTPREMTEEEITATVAAFGQATRRAIAAGFDGVELHGAHGFLLQNFLSPLYNQRRDGWGGSAEARMRFPRAVVAEVRRVIAEAGRPFLLGYRISPSESEAGGLQLADAVALGERLQGQIDYLHVSLQSILAPEGRAALTAFAQAVGDLPLIAAGGVRTPAEAEAALALGLSMVALGKALVMNPDWVKLAQEAPRRIATRLDPAKVPGLRLPARLWAGIQALPGWFQIGAENG